MGCGTVSVKQTVYAAVVVVEQTVQFPHSHSLNRSILPHPSMLSIDVINTMLKTMREGKDLFHCKPLSTS